MKRAKTRKWLAGLLVAVAAGVAGCQDAGTGVDRQVPSGLVVLDARGNTVASVEGSRVSGAIEVRAGQPETFEVRLTSADGETISLGGRFSLQPRVLIGPLASVSVNGSSRLVITGNSSGTTSLVLDVVEGGTVVIGPFIPLTVQ